MTYKEIDMRWDTFSFPVKAGTPVCAAGVEADDSTAIGIIPQTIESRPLMSRCLIMVEGVVDSRAIKSITTDAKKAMTGITFFDGEVNNPAPVMTPYTPTNATTTKAGIVKKASKVSDVATGEDATAAANADAINDIISKLKSAGIMAS